MLYKILTGFVTLCLIASLTAIVYSNYKLKQLEREHYNLIAKNDSLIIMKHNIASRLSMVDEDNKKLLNDNQDLYNLIKKQREEIKTLSLIKIKYEQLIMAGAGIDTVYIDSTGVTKYKVTFSDSKDGVKIWGYTVTPPPYYELNVDREPLTAVIAIVQDKKKNWRSYIQTSTGKVDSLVTNVVPYREKWYQKIKPIVSASAYNNGGKYDFGIGLGVSYGTYYGMYGMTTFGNEYRLMKSFSIF